MCEISPFLIFIFTLLFTTCRSFIAGLFWKLGAVAHLFFVIDAAKHQTNRVNPPERIESHAKSNYTARTHTHLRSTKVPRHLQLSVRWSVTWTIVSRCDRCNNNHNNHRVTSSCTHCVVLIKEKGVYIFWSPLYSKCRCEVVINSILQFDPPTVKWRKTEMQMSTKDNADIKQCRK